MAPVLFSPTWRMLSSTSTAWHAAEVAIAADVLGRMLDLRRQEYLRLA